MDMSQEDIDKMLNQSGNEPEAPAASNPASTTGNMGFSNDDIDAIGEIGNIFMGSASTTLSTILNNKVEITTPRIEIFNSLEESSMLQEDHAVVEINYIEGLEGTVVFALKVADTAIIADLMMGGTGKVESQEIGELQLSAVSEAMNQMVGSASTSLSSMLNRPINISHPNIRMFGKENKEELNQDLVGKKIASIKFTLKVGDLINSEITQLMSADAAKAQVDAFMATMKNATASMQDSANQSMVDGLMQGSTQPQSQTPEDFFNSAPQAGHTPPQNPVTVQPVQFASFDNAPGTMGTANQNLNLVMDVDLKLTVELGRTELPIKDVLELTRGSIIELDKVAGEPVELYANGKLIAKGEVVVIEDNFGLRITSIISPEHRIKQL